MKENLQYWDKLSRPPKEALKEIKGGRLRGKSDINPQWRMKAMTEAFGPVGLGWKYTIDKLWLERGEAPEVCAFAQVTVQVKYGEEWSEPFNGIGGSAFVTKEQNGIYTSDEAYKMAVTDALSVAFKAVGVAGEIYMGNWDGSKYKNVAAPSYINIDQENELDDLIKEVKADKVAFLKYLNIDTLDRLPATAYGKAKAALKAKVAK